MVDRAIRLTVGYLRSQCGLRLAPVWDLDDVRQSAALHYLVTGSADAAAKATWSEFRRNRRYHRFQSPGLPETDVPEQVRQEPIPEKYFEGCSDRERAALIFAYECDMNGPEIAESLGCTRKAANLLLIRGRRKARAAI